MPRQNKSKSPLSILNESCLNRYKAVPLGKSGPDHNPIYKWRIEMDNFRAEGTGKSEKDAKQNAAMKLIRAIFLAGREKDYGFGNKPEDMKVLSGFIPIPKAISKKSNQIKSSNPVVRLNELCQREKLPMPAYLLLSSSGRPHEPVFWYLVYLGQLTEKGSGQSKQKAKQSASSKILIIIERLSEHNRRQKIAENQIEEGPQIDNTNGNPIEQNGADLPRLPFVPKTVILCQIMPDWPVDTYYRNFSNPKGLAIIINQFEFPNTKWDTRYGTDIDCEAMEKLFTEFGYRVTVHENLTGQQIHQEMKNFATNPEHENFDSAIVVLLSHGFMGKIIASDGEAVRIDELSDYLNGTNCKFLANKPKLFFIQACRIVETDSDELISAKQDFFFFYSTAAGDYSLRNRVSGGLFIRAVCEVFAEYAHCKDLHQLGVLVKKRVVELCRELANEICKQIPESTDTISRIFYFFPGIVIR